MYAVIRAGGKQYRVAPGDVVKIEKTSNSDQNIEFEVLAVSGEEGKIAKAEDAKVVGESSERAAPTRFWSFTLSARSSTRS